jgi:thioredoxin 1
MPDFLASKDEFDRCLRANPAVVVDFTASWCGPCKMVAPQFAAMAKEFPTVTFAKVDVDDNKDVAQDEGVTAMPTFVMYKKGRRVDTVRGADPSKLRAMVEKHAPVKVDLAAYPPERLSGMKVAELKGLLADLGQSSDDCFEKGDLVQKLSALRDAAAGPKAAPPRPKSMPMREPREDPPAAKAPTRPRSMPQPPPRTAEELDGLLRPMSNRELLSLIARAGLSSDGCAERSEILAVAADAQRALDQQ